MASAQLTRAREFLVLHDSETHTRHDVLLPGTDIDAHIEFSYARSVFYLIGILLVLTDIPRTGLSTDVKRVYGIVAPSTSMYYGPFEYHMAHLVRDERDDGLRVLNGSCDGSPIDSMEVWSYKFDTLSIPPRAMAQHLSLTSFPRCLLYKQHCPTSTLPLDTVFRMLDDLVTRLQATYFRGDDRTRPLRFLTNRNWIDRLHHRITRVVWRYQDHRVHTFHYYTVPRRRNTSVQICAPRRLGHHQLPPICTHPVAWRCADPFKSDAPRTLQLWDHIERRVERLRDEYPDLQLDLLLTTTQIWASKSKTSIVPSAYFISDNIEITTVVRGRRCLADDHRNTCETVMIDEYRYERATIETNVEEWRLVTSVLRATAQIFIWMRVLLLLWGCYCARSAEPKLRNRSFGVKLLVTVKTFFRIPSHVVIYTNWVAIVCYALAHYVDSNVVHLMSDAFWSTLNGFVAFNLTEYITYASVQMRNVWLIAVFWKCVMVVHSAIWLHPGTQWRPQLGVFSIRSLFLSTVSCLTVFSFYPSRQFRDTNIVLIRQLPRIVPRDATQEFGHMNTISEFGFRLDIKTMVIASVFLAIHTLLVQSALRVLTRRQSRFMTCRSFYVPLSAGVLWPASMLHIFWFLPIARSRTGLISSVRRSNSIRQSWLHVVAATVSPSSSSSSLKPTSRTCRVCSQPTSVLHWRRTQGCWRHEPIFDPDFRTIEVWSMVRLINIGLMSDPFVLAQLYLVGQPIALSLITPRQALYSSRVASSKATTTQSYRSDDGGEELSRARSTSSTTISRRETFIILAPINRQITPGSTRPMIGSVCSASVPWHALVNCG